jgi:NAD(P)-dependent dehydrogenase (short-subunit alcohol dehydrogenase family)
MKDFKDKVVVITGGATGIGFSFARQFGKEGAKVVICGLRENRLQEAVKKLIDLGIEARFLIADVTKREAVEALADFAWKEFGHVDVIMNNAGIVSIAKVIDSTENDFRKIYGVNIFGVLNGSSVFGKRFIKQGTLSAIYNVGSENSLFNGVPMGAPYISSKHAVLALTEALREEVPDFIEVGLICPGFTRSELGGGDSEMMKQAMDTDTFTAIAMEQIKNDEFYIVSHAYNILRINERYEAIKKSYERYAPRYEGDDEYDIRTLYKKQMEIQRGGSNE